MLLMKNQMSTTPTRENHDLAEDRSCAFLLQWHEELVSICRKYHVEYYYFSSSLLAYSNVIPDQMILDRCPRNWNNHLQIYGFDVITPLFYQFGNACKFMIWSQKDQCISAEERRFNNEAKKYGIEAGITFSYRPIPAHQAVFSLATSEPLASSMLIDPSVQREFDLLGARLVQAHWEKLGTLPDKLIDKYTNREIECMRLVAEGKTDADIAAILGIARRTVVFHIQNVMVKTKTHSRTSAAVKSVLYVRI